MTSQKGLSAYSDGIVGLQPVPSNDTSGLGPSYLTALKDQGVIDRAIFGLYLTPDEDYSNIQIGNYNASYINGTTANITWYDCLYDDKWSLSGYTNYGQTAHEINPTDYIIDSGNRKIGFPTTIWNNFVTLLEADSPTIFCDDNIAMVKRKTAQFMDLSCKTSSITFDASATTPSFVVPGDRLMAPQGITYPCELGVYNSGTSGILGDLFLYEYYTIFDMEYLKIGVAPAIQMDITWPPEPDPTPIPDPEPEPEPTPTPTPEPEPTPVPEPDEDDDDDKKKEEEEDIASVLAIIMMISCIGFVICLVMYIRHKRAQETVVYNMGAAYTADDEEIPRSNSSVFRDLNASDRVTEGF
eukprot:CAMPEP_0176355084 /NCGR_PEP_ID=MMETSP0126-20121128/13039_1 /TAXON_ID=141414 ORGANISM="Strombidinopsis acuminatum, Strain SPMC142" /NCGR_SAMPLE_ID=MMETSP0126 /ASSEMBLY_ACC=CAM_ASM_000229 /LENGTH=354 /DNA_ID=CAMNT_0017707577 /DNA_START=459 /DNA_END=1523 /DNA_ORIENTATION=+